MYGLSLLLSNGLAYHVTSRMTFAFAISPEAAATLTTRVQAIRAVGLGFAALLMLLVIFAASRASRGALAVRWVLGAATSIALLRASGMVGQLAQHDIALIVTSAVQLIVEAFAILLLYGDNANEWFEARC